MFYARILADRRWMSENTQKVQLVQCTVRTHSGFCLASRAWQKMTDVCWRYVDHMAVMWSAIYCCEGVRILQLPRLLQASSWFPLNSSYKPNSSLHFTTLLCVLWPTSKPYTMMTVHIFSWLQYVMLCFLLISWCWFYSVFVIEPQNWAEWAVDELGLGEEIPTSALVLTCVLFIISVHNTNKESALSRSNRQHNLLSRDSSYSSHNTSSISRCSFPSSSHCPESHRGLPSPLRDRSQDNTNLIS